MDALYYFLEPSFWSDPLLIVLFGLSIFSVVFIRYLVAATGLHWGLLSFSRNYRRRNPVRNTGQIKRELRWSSISSLVFAVLSVMVFYLERLGLTKLYGTDSALGPNYFVLSIVLYLALYETYYYWLHRWMHKPTVFRYVHRAHHESISTSVFTSFSFHPLEALLQFMFFPLAVMVIPIHIAALLIVLTIMTISAVINHAGVEIFPKRLLLSRLGQWLIGSTHHDLHHREFRSNFGLYLTWWDKWMGTESKNYKKRIDSLRD